METSFKLSRREKTDLILRYLRRLHSLKKSARYQEPDLRYLPGHRRTAKANSVYLPEWCTDAVGAHAVRP